MPLSRRTDESFKQHTVKCCLVDTMHKSRVEARKQEKAHLRDTLQPCKHPRSIQRDPRGQGSATFNITRAILAPFPPDTILVL